MQKIAGNLLANWDVKVSSESLMRYVILASVAFLFVHHARGQDARDCTDLGDEIKALLQESPALGRGASSGPAAAAAFAALGEEELVASLIVSAEGEAVSDLLFTAIAGSAMSDAGVSKAKLLKLVDSTQVRDDAIRRAAIFLGTQRDYEAAIALADAIAQQATQEFALDAIAIKAISNDDDHVAATLLGSTNSEDVQKRIADIRDRTKPRGWELQVADVPPNWRPLVLRELRKFRHVAAPMDLSRPENYVSGGDRGARRAISKWLSWGLKASRESDRSEIRRAIQHIMEYRNTDPDVWCNSLPLLGYFNVVLNRVETILDLAFRKGDFSGVPNCDNGRVSSAVLAALLCSRKSDAAISLINSKGLDIGSAEALADFGVKHLSVSEYIAATRKVENQHIRMELLSEGVLRCIRGPSFKIETIPADITDESGP